jgi:hypothetical protein
MATRTQLLAPGVTEAAGNPFTVDSGQVTLMLVPGAGAPINGGALIQIQVQNGADWTTVGAVSGRSPLVTFDALGTFRPFRQDNQSAPIGLDVVTP